MFFDGNYYPSKARGERADRLSFTVVSRRAGQGVEGAQEAAMHEGKRYCLENFGTSAIDWGQGQAGQDGPVFARSGDRLSVSGRCVIWR